MQHKKILSGLFFGMIFLFFVIFFTTIHPIILFDMDDWYYAFIHRAAIPLWKYWNPIRMFAEVFMPIVSMIGAYVFHPLIGDFLVSLTYSYAITVSSVFTVLLYMLYRHFKGRQYCLVLITFFIICHFWIFRTANEGNHYMLGTNDACTYFFYVIPNLLNCILVLWMWEADLNSFIRKSYIQKALFVFLVYIAIFSNLWSGAITASYIGSVLLMDFPTIFNKASDIKTYCKNHTLEFAVLFVWFISQIYELNGGRASSLAVDYSYIDSLTLTLKALKELATRLNSVFALCIIAIILSGTVAIMSRQKQAIKTIVTMSVSFFIMMAYLIVSCAKAGYGYIYRPDVIYGCFFFGMMIVLHCAHQIIRTIPPVYPLVPVILLIALVDCNTEGKTFREANLLQLSPQVCADVGNDIIKQLSDADKEGKKEVEIYVPQFEATSNDNWPIALYAADRMSAMLYKMGITDTRITATFVPVESKNIELRIN